MAKRRPRRMSDEAAMQVLKWYASLELEPGATMEKVEEAYGRLSKRYHPSRHEGNPAKHAAAVELMDSLTAAYDGLRLHKTRTRQA